MSKMSELHQMAKEYLELGDEIKKLTEARKDIQKELAKTLPVGNTVEHEGHLYEWIEYERASKSYKALYTEAYGMLPDTEQVIMGEQERKNGKTTIHHKFDKQTP